MFNMTCISVIMTTVVKHNFSVTKALMRKGQRKKFNTVTKQTRNLQMTGNNLQGLIWRVKILHSVPEEGHCISVH